MPNPLDGLDLGKTVAGAPLGVWVVGVGGALGFILYRRNAAADTAIPEDDGSSPLYENVGSGAVGGYVANDTPAPPEAPGITDNASWARAAINYLIAQNYDPAISDSAVRKYLMGVSQSVTEYALIKIVLVKFGPPPGGLTSKPTDPPVAPKPPVSVPKPVASRPAPKPAPKPVAKPSVRTYTVRVGDNLSRIAQRYYGRQDWQRIYNANRGKISNPNLIYPGQVLVIP